MELSIRETAKIRGGQDVTQTADTFDIGNLRGFDIVEAYDICMCACVGCR